MSEQPKNDFSELRQKAEVVVGPEQREVGELSLEQIRVMFHDLQVHQVELEMQNEELRKVQRDLETSRDNYSRLYNHAPVGYLSVDQNGIILQANQTFAEMVGMHFSELHRKTISSLIDPRDRDIFFARFKAFFKKPADKHMEVRLMVGKEREFYARLEGRLVKEIGLHAGAQDDPGLLLLIISDITELKRAEEALKATSQQMSEILESISDAFFSLDDDFRITYSNSAAESIWGKKRAEVLGRDLLSVLPEVRGSLFEANYRKALREKRFLAFETYFDRPPYDDWYGVRIYPRPKGISVYFRVITDRVRLEQQYRQAQKMEAVGQLAGGVAHHFNNLLQVVLGQVEMAMDDVVPQSPVYRNLHQIRKATHRSVALIRQLMDFSRQKMMRAERLDLNRTLSSLMKMLHQVAGEGIAIELVPGLEIEASYADPGQMEQILINLVLNSREAMPGGGRIVIETKNVRIDADFCKQNPWAREGPYVLISFSDTGPGIAPEFRERIFEPFFSTKEKSKGAGLGLSTVYGIVKQHEGLIDFDGRPGLGASFFIYLPAALQEAGGNAHASGALPGDPSASPAEGACILLAEEDLMVRDIAAQILARGGYRLLLARTGEEIERILKDRGDDIDLMLVDMLILKMSGSRTVIDHIWADGFQIPVLLSIGYDFHLMDACFASSQKYQFVQKPYELYKLLQKVKEVLREKKTALP